MPSRKVSITTNPVASRHDMQNERTIEYSFPDGKASGGLITFFMADDGRLIVDMHGHDTNIEIRVGKPRRSA